VEIPGKTKINMLGIITVNYNQYGMTQEFLDSLKKISGSRNVFVYIADTSTKKENYYFKNNFKGLYLDKIDNKGYAYGINQGVFFLSKKGVTEFCVINNDVYFDDDFLAETNRTFEKADIFTGKIYYAPGYEYHKNRYKKNELGRVIWYAGGIVDWNNVYTKHRGVDEVDNKQYDSYGKTDFISGCLVCFNDKVWKKTGPWDESYFLYYEDADYSEKAKRAGFKLIYNPKIVIWHKVAQSTGGSGSNLHRIYQGKNRIKFGLRYAPFRTKVHLIKEKFLSRF
jgi:GT2 family glycosyltransferase